MDSLTPEGIKAELLAFITESGIKIGEVDEDCFLMKALELIGSVYTFYYFLRR